MASFAQPEGQPAFPVADTETDNSADSPSVEEEKDTDTEQTPSSEEDKGSDENKDAGASDNDDDTNLAKHPRWKEREDDWKNRFNEQETRHQKELDDKISALREEFEGKLPKGETSDEVPAWFGGDKAAWDAYRADQAETIKQATENIRNEARQKEEAQQKAIQEATDFMNSEVAGIEGDKTLNPDGVKVDRNKLFKFVHDNKLVDTEGRWNYRAGWQLMQAGVKSAKKETIQEKKEVANATNSESRAETEKPNYTTSEDFQNPSERPW